MDYNDSHLVWKCFSIHIISITSNNPPLAIGLSLEGGFGLLYYAGQTDWLRVGIKFSSSLQYKLKCTYFLSSNILNIKSAFVPNTIYIGIYNCCIIVQNKWIYILKSISHCSITPLFTIASNCSIIQSCRSPLGTQTSPRTRPARTHTRLF